MRETRIVYQCKQDLSRSYTARAAQAEAPDRGAVECGWTARVPYLYALSTSYPSSYESLCDDCFVDCFGSCPERVRPGRTAHGTARHVDVDIN